MSAVDSGIVSSGLITERSIADSLLGLGAGSERDGRGLSAEPGVSIAESVLEQARNDEAMKRRRNDEALILILANI